MCAHCVRNDCLLPDNKLLARQKVYNESASKLWILRGKNKTNNGTHGTIWPFCDKVNTTVGCAVNTEHGFKQELTAFSHRSKLSKNREKKKKFSFIYSSSEPLQRKSAKQNQAVTWGEKKKSRARMAEKFGLRMWEISFHARAFFTRLFTFLLRYTVFQVKVKCTMYCMCISLSQCHRHFILV